jgi:hypothetical protein
MPIPSSCVTRAAASSASGCTIDCTPIGEVITGAASCWPSTVVVRSRSVAPASMRGTMRQRSKASRLARAVAPVDAAPATYRNGRGSIASRAAASSPCGSVVKDGTTPVRPAA